MLFRTLTLTAFLCSTCIGSLASPVDAASMDDIDSFLQNNGLTSAANAVIAMPAPAPSDKAPDLIVTAMGFLGLPYRFGGNTAETGFDCSGFVRAMYSQVVGFVLPRSASEQAASTTSIEKTELQPGDLVFFNTLRRAFSHVGIYVGNGKFIHSPRAGGSVRIEDMGQSYWQTRFNGARRVSTAPVKNNPRPQ